MSTSQVARSLADLSPGDSAVVQNVRCSPAIRLRLLEMGLLPGTPVTVVRTAPLGDPMQLRIRDYDLSIRRDDAAAVAVTSRDV